MRLKRWLICAVCGFAIGWPLLAVLQRWECRAQAQGLSKQDSRVAAATPADTSTSAQAITWKKTVVDRVFRSEGVAIADVNRDGKMDILAGDVWYEAPDWKMHEIRKPGNYGDGAHTYSECFAC